MNFLILFFACHASMTSGVGDVTLTPQQHDIDVEMQCFPRDQMLVGKGVVSSFMKTSARAIKTKGTSKIHFRIR